MGDLESPNLIDFSAEDLIQIQTPPQSQQPTASKVSPSSFIAEGATSTLAPNRTLDSPSQMLKQDSLDNNPFDVVQKMACRPPDPFDIVEKEACQKARLMLTPVEVKEGQLLSLSTDSFPNESVDDFIKPTSQGTKVETQNILEGESTPESTPGSVNCVDSASSTESPISTKTKKTMEHRKRLLKLSLSNTTLNSPASRHTGLADNSTISMILSEAAQVGEQSIAQESPLKLVTDDDDLIETNWTDSQKDFDHDLEMMKIPILKKLPSPVIEEQLPQTLAAKSAHQDDKAEIKKTEPLMDLAAIRAKLKARRELCYNNQDVTMLIKSLRSLIADINVDDANKRKEATNLLDTLSSAISERKSADKIQNEEEELVSPQPPQPILRQRTFDVELEENENQADRVLVENTYTSHYIPSASTNIPSGLKDVPEEMVKSSATYDGETAEDKDFILPKIQVQHSPTPLPLDVNEIVEQLGKILEQHQLNSMHTSEAGSVVGSSQTTAVNPTFIVVMPQTPLTTPPIPNAHRRRSCLEKEFEDASPLDIAVENIADPTMRRRSQSLSIHDKIRVVQLPIRQSNDAQLSAEALRATLSNVSSAATPNLDPTRNEFTPSRTLRRNSFSNVTPCTAKYSSYMLNAQRRVNGISNLTSQRESTVLATHPERQEFTNSASNVSMQHLNLSSLKSQYTIRKKTRTSTVDSILKSSVPMKATVPVKKVAPIMKTSQNTDTAQGKTKAHSAPVDTSMELIAKSSKMLCTSTPLTLPHLAGGLDVSTGFPNACSTPTVRTSPMKRSAFGSTKSRYSYLAATPSAKQHLMPAPAGSPRRRTISEFKAKSPTIPRINGAGGAVIAAATANVKAGTGTSRNSLKTPSISSRTINKIASTINGRTSTRLSTRTSFGGTAASQRNKENKF